MKQDKKEFLDIAGFRDAAPYIYAHRGHIFVVMFDGAAIEGDDFPALIHDIALLHCLGIKLVLVHGARPQIASRLKRHAIQQQYHEGLRVTDSDSLAIVKEAVGSVRVEIESLLSTGLINTPMSGMKLRVNSGNFITARPLGVRDGIDFAHTGEVRKVDVEGIRQQLELDNIVLLSCLGYSPSGETFNLSAADIASMTAASLQAHKLIFMLEGEVLRDSKRKTIKQLTLSEAETLLQGRRKLGEELRTAIENGVNACLNNVRRVHLIDRHTDGALLREIYTRDGDGTGTLITAETYEGLRQATIDDVGGIIELIQPLEDRGMLVRRSREQLELEIQRFSVIERDGMIIACAALYPYPEEHVGELTCLAVHADYQNSGRAGMLLKQLEGKAMALHLKTLFVLTTHTAHWFREHGFHKGDFKALPVKRRELYNYQRNSIIYSKPLK